jgi:RNase P/RNase MRP subunit POP5
MKPKSKKTKLQLKKQAISNLLNKQLENVKAGKANIALILSSYGPCTGILCCDRTATYTTITE